MANTTLTVAEVTGLSNKLVQSCGGIKNMPGASIKAFTATAGTGRVPVGGFTLNLSALFPNKVLMAVVSALHDPARTTGDLAYPAVYIPATNGAPATGVIHVYAATYAAAGTTGLVKTADDTEVVDGFVVTGFAIGY